MRGLNFLDSLQQWNGQGDFTPEALRRVMRYLGNPQDNIPSVHVAGTNGKGSVCAAVASMLGAAGYRVALNISPHLVRINERIVVDGASIANEALDETALELKGIMEKLGETLTYHEALTALAFLVSKNSKVDWMVIEVGLGGRLDASNVLKRPEACVITSIGLDHQHILGTTKATIAYEKAGIIKEGSRLLTGRIESEALNVIAAEAKARGVPHTRWGEHYSAELLGRQEGNGYAVEFQDLVNDEQCLFSPGLKGSFQVSNMALAIAVGRGIGLSLSSCKEGVEKVFWPARFEKIGDTHRLIILDCAHNMDGIEALVDSLRFEGLSEVPVAFGCLDTKNWHEMIDILRPCAKSWRLLLPQSTRAVPTSKVAEYLSCSGIKATDFSDNYEAFVADIQNEELLVVAGSIYMVGQVRALLGGEEKLLWRWVG